MKTIFILASSLLSSLTECGGSEIESIKRFIQTDTASLSSVQNSLTIFLREHSIPIGDQPRSLKRFYDSRNQQKLVVTVSNESNEVECRVSLDRAPLGSKVSNEKMIHHCFWNIIMCNNESIDFMWSMCSVFRPVDVVDHNSGFNSQFLTECVAVNRINGNSVRHVSRSLTTVALFVTGVHLAMS